MSNVSSRQLVLELSGGMCDALINIEPQVWARCGKQPVEVHHRLPRSRGGLLLDDVGETYHLLALCRQHHKHAHESIDAFTTGLMLEGRVLSGTDGHPIYEGADPYLSEHYSALDLQRMREGVRGAKPGKRLREET